MTTTSRSAVQSNRFRYALPAQRLPKGAYELSTVWRIPGPPLPYNSSSRASMWRLVPPDDVRQTSLLQRNTNNGKHCRTPGTADSQGVYCSAKY
jgi:hypothetical protein